MSACSFDDSISQNYFKNETGKVFNPNATSTSPDIQSLFTSFNKRFFWSCLNDVEVFWSNRMTRSAGICYYRANKKEKRCYIRLSSPLLKLRPHGDVVDTILHEMIHAYLFVTNKGSNRDGHGPNFHKHKDRINKEAGTNITVYHSFHSEVKLYKQHWWRCNGPCQFESPYFGMIKRSMNRPPGPNDSWWNGHEAQCSGTYTKIREPVEYTKKKNKVGVMKGQEYRLENIIDIVDLTHLIPGASAATFEDTKKGSLSLVTIDLTNEPTAKRSKTDTEVCPCPVCNMIVPRLSVAEHLESCDGMQSIFDFDLDLIDDMEVSDDDNSEDVIEPKKKGQSCPICSSCIEGDLKSHVDDCLNTSGVLNIFSDEAADLHESTSVEKKFNDCPICGLTIFKNLEDHVDNCLNNSIDERDLDISDCKLPEKTSDTQTKDSKTCLNNSFNSDSFNVRNVTICPVCNKTFKNNIEDHVNDCLNHSMSSSDFDEPMESKPVSPKTIINQGLTKVPKDLDSFKSKHGISSSKGNGDRNISPVINKYTEKSLPNQNSHCFTFSVGSNDHSQNSKTVGLKTNSAIVDLTISTKHCPVCAKFIEYDMNFHLDQCLNKSCTVADFDDSIVVISDNESPVKLLDTNSEFPLPKILDTDNNDSERRTACRICGMRFGVSKFNGHVCYER